MKLDQGEKAMVAFHVNCQVAPPFYLLQMKYFIVVFASFFLGSSLLVYGEGESKTSTKDTINSLPASVFLQNNISHAIGISRVPISYVIDFTDDSLKISRKRQDEAFKEIDNLWENEKDALKLLDRLVQDAPTHRIIKSNTSFVIFPKKKSIFDEKISLEINNADVQTSYVQLVSELRKHFEVFAPQREPVPYSEDGTKKISLKADNVSVLELLSRFSESLGPDVYWYAGCKDQHPKLLVLSFMK